MKLPERTPVWRTRSKQGAFRPHRTHSAQSHTSYASVVPLESPEVSILFQDGRWVTRRALHPLELKKSLEQIAAPRACLWNNASQNRGKRDTLPGADPLRGSLCKESFVKG